MNGKKYINNEFAKNDIHLNDGPSDNGNSNAGIMIAMSGGVDSSVAALLSMNEFEKCAGGTMKLLPDFNSDDANKVAERLGIPFYLFDLQNEFEESVIDPFIETYSSGGTPNPCIMCNHVMKFGLFLDKARSLGYNKVATGHYARIWYDENRNRYVLGKAYDLSKDQSYFLYSLTQDQLRSTYLPLGEMTKDETRLVASEQGFDNAHKKDSQDICFVQDGNYAGFIEDYSSNESPQGDFVDMDGNVLGIHKGIIRYTIGQRKGLGLALPEPMYVCRKDMDNNRVVLGRNDQLFGHTVMAENINLITSESLEGPTRVNAKIRYNQTEQPATVTQTGEDELRIVFDEPQRAIAAGQSVVMYDGDIVVGGGIIR